MKALLVERRLRWESRRFPEAARLPVGRSLPALLPAGRAAAGQRRLYRPGSILEHARRPLLGMPRVWPLGFVSELKRTSRPMNRRAPRVRGAAPGPSGSRPLRLECAREQVRVVAGGGLTCRRVAIDAGEE